MRLGTSESGGIARRVAAELRKGILSGSLQVGQRIAGEHQLMSRFAVSRQTVREALRELGTEGLVVSRRGPGGGAFVAAPNLNRISELMHGAGTMIAVGDRFSHEEVCIAIFSIEAACCRLAAERRDPVHIRSMRRAIVNASKAPQEPRAFFDHYTAFNRALWSASGNAPLAFVMNAFMQSLRRALPRDAGSIDWNEYRQFLQRNHRAILTAIQSGDADRGVKLLEENRDFWIRHPPESCT